MPMLTFGGVLVLAVAALGGSVAVAAQATVTLAVVVPTGAPTVEITWSGRPTPFLCGEGNRCSVDVPDNQSVKLTALGAFSSSDPFNGWAGACSGTSPTCTLAMTANREVLVRRKLTVSPQRGTDGSAGFGTVAFSPAGASCQPTCQFYDNETAITLTATPSAGHFFYRWDDPNDPIQPDPCEGGEFVATCTLRTKLYDTPIVALFLPDATLQLAVTGNAGVVTASPGGECQAGNSDCKFAARGTRVRLTPKAVSGSTFAGWSVPECPGTGDCTIVLDARLRTVVANFVPTQVTVGVVNSGTVRSTESQPRISCGGSATQCEADYTTLAEVTLTASPANAFRGWYGVCAFAGTAPTCTFRLSGHDDVGAWFNGPDGPPVIVPPRIDYEVEVRRTGNGNGTVRSNRSPRAQEQIECGAKCDATFFEDEVVVLQAQETAGSTFGGWKVAGARCATDRTCTIPVRGSTRVEVAFSSSGGGGGRCSVRRVGGPGGNRLDGGNRGDAIFGRAGNDRIWGFGGDDCLHGEAGNDVLRGGPGRDLLNGGPGADTLDGGPGADTLNGGPGRDLVLARDGQRDTIACGPGRDTVRADRLDRVAGCELVRRSR